MATQTNYRHNIRNNKGQFAPKDPNAPPKRRRSRSKNKAKQLHEKLNKLDKLVELTKKELNTKPIVNNVCFVIDGSGSMQHLTEKVRITLNEWLGNLKDEATSKVQDTYVSVVSFSGKSTVNCVEKNSSVFNVMPFQPGHNYFEKRRLYYGSMTALYDAIGKANQTIGDMEITQVTKYKSSVEMASLMIVMTDGMENDSRMGQTEFNSLMKRMVDDPTLTLVFLVPCMSSKAELVDRGVPESNIRVWENTFEGIQKVKDEVTTGLQGYYQCRSMGETSMMGFFADNQ